VTTWQDAGLDEQYMEWPRDTAAAIAPWRSAAAAADVSRA
jgi:hypothetical protein